MKRLKYIMTKQGPMIFDPCITHKDAASGLGEVLSAGFVQIYYSDLSRQFVCTPFGNSITLNKEADEVNDKIKLEHLLNSRL